MWATIARKKIFVKYNCEINSQLGEKHCNCEKVTIVKYSHNYEKLYKVTLWDKKFQLQEKKKLHLEQNKAALKVNKSKILGSKMSTLVNNAEK